MATYSGIWGLLWDVVSYFRNSSTLRSSGVKKWQIGVYMDLLGLSWAERLIAITCPIW